MRFRAHEGCYIYNIQNRRGLLRCLSSVDGQCEGLNCGISNRYSSHAFRICGDKTKNSIKKPVRGTTGTINRFMHKVNLFPRTQVWANLWKAALLSLLCITTFSCSNELQMLFPEGPAGKSAYEVWMDGVNDGTIDWPKDRTDVNNFFLYLKGEDGKDGQDGADGKSAYEIWIAEVEAGLDNPKNPGTDWPKDQTDINDFWYYLTGADGKDGVTPNIGDNGHWWVGGEDTGIDAQGPQGPQGEPGEDGEDGEDGQDGQDGKPGTGGSMPDIYIDEETNHWIINGEDTGVSAKGEDGDDGDKGADGLSAYELWKIEVAKGTAIKNDEPWDKNKTTISDFWEFLRGNDGEDGEDGQDGEDEGAETAPVKGQYNVIAYRSDIKNEEYVNWPDGTLTFKVYDKKQEPVAEGAKVKISGLKDAADQEFTVGKDGLVTIPKKYLPDEETRTTAQVKVGDGEWETTPENTLVSARIDTKIVLQETGDLSGGVTSPLMLSLMTDGVNDQVPCLNIQFKVLRKVGKDGTWEAIPDYVGATTKDVYLYTYGENASEIDEDAEGEKLNIPRDKNIDIAKMNTCMVQVQRKVIATGENKIDATKILENDIWKDGTKESVNYITIGVKECYGDNPILQAKIEMRPAQYAPLLKSLTQTGKIVESSGGTSSNVSLEGEFDTDMIEESLCFVQDYEQKENAEEILTYGPKAMTDDDFKTKDLFEITFAQGSNIVTNKDPQSGQLNTNKKSPTFTADNVWVNSVLTIKVRFGAGKISQSINFYPLNEFGVIEKDSSDETKVKYRTYMNSQKHPVSSDYELEVTKEDKSETEE